MLLFLKSPFIDRKEDLEHSSNDATKNTFKKVGGVRANTTK